MRFCKALALLACLSACAPQLQTRLESFSAPPPPAATSSFFVLAGSREQAASLESQQWVSLTAAQLAKRRFQLAPSLESADYVAVVGLGMDRGQTVNEPISIPQWGVTGYSGAQSFGTVSRFGNVASYSGTTTLTPTYGVTGYTTSVVSRQVFTREGVLSVFRRSAGPSAAPVFQARGISEGSCGLLSVVAPALIETLFAKFPQGGSGTVQMPFQGSC